MNNPNAPYQIPEDDSYEPERFGLYGYADEQEMLDGLKTQAAIRQAIERPRVHYGYIGQDIVARKNNRTGAWEPFSLNGYQGWTTHGNCPACNTGFSSVPTHTVEPEERAVCKCGWVGTVKELLPCAS